MGTNYYARIIKCEHCGKYKEIHIGKSSSGWTFSFHATSKIKSYGDWLDFLSKKDVEIYDEYEKRLTLREFKDLVEEKRNSSHNQAKEYPTSSYLDVDGNSMSNYKFS